jgi:hypothetical protein
MDLAAWSRVVARLLKPDGRLYVFEGHPLDWVWDQNASELRLDPEPPYGDYFSEGVGMEKGWPETYIPTASLPPASEQAPKHERQWTLGHILNSLVEAGLRLERFEEYSYRYWKQYPYMSHEIASRVPHTFSLLMRKE